MLKPPGAAARRCHIGEDMILLAPIEEIGGGGSVASETNGTSVFENHDDAIGIGVGKRPEDHCAERREDSAIGSDAERQRYECNSGEHGRKR